MNKIKEITKSGFQFFLLSLITIFSILSIFNVNDIDAKVEQDEIKVLVGIDESYATTLSNQTKTGNISLLNTTILDNEINILNHSSFIDILGYMHIVGEVKNNTTKIADFVSVKGTFYDNNNNILGTALNYTEPRSLNSSETASFDLVLQNTSIPIGQIEKYILRPVWD